MKTYKTSQNNIDKGILIELKNSYWTPMQNGYYNNDINTAVIIDNRIKGFFLKEMK